MIEIENIVIKFTNDKKINLSYEEAKELWVLLNKFFGINFYYTGDSGINYSVTIDPEKFYEVTIGDS